MFLRNNRFSELPSKPVAMEKLDQNTSKEATDRITRECRRTGSCLAPPTGKKEKEEKIPQ